MWLGVHLGLLSDMQVKVETFVQWIWNYFHEQRGPQLHDRSDEARIDWYGDKPNAKAGPEK